MKTGAVHSNSDQSITSIGTIILTVLLAVTMPRFINIGGLPSTDEGFYAYHAQLTYTSISAGMGLPDSGMLMLYPTLLSWIFAFDVNPLVALRLMDMIFATISGYMLYKIIEIESGSRIGAVLISLVFLFTMNQTTFIQYGFKNSIFVAYIPLFAALWLGLTASRDVSKFRWVTVGVFLSISMLLRETFLPLILLGAIAILVQRGARPFAAVMVGAVSAGALILWIIISARGSVVGLVESYQYASKYYSSMNDIRYGLFFNSAKQFIQTASVAIIIAGVGFLFTLFRSLGCASVIGLPKLGFWLAFTLVPLIEPTMKIGFPYHFSVCLPGMAGLAALGWRNFWGESEIARRSFLCFAVLTVSALAVQIPKITLFLENWKQSRQVLSSFRERQWPDIFIDKSNYLLAANTILRAAPPAGTLVVSGFMHTLYPLTGLLPPKPGLANLSSAIIDFDFSASRLLEALLLCPPDVIMTTSRTDWPGGLEILEAVRETGIYEEIGEIPVTANRSYGSFGGSLFRATKKYPCK